MTAPPSARESRGAGLRTAVSLGAKAAPGALAALVLLTVAAAAIPVVAAWLTKGVLDRLADAAPWPAMVAMAAGLAVAGVVAAILPHLADYARGTFGRRVGLLAMDRLYLAVNGFAGLSRFEDPAFLNRLRTAQQVGLSTPAQVMATGLTVVRAAVMAAGFVGSLLLISRPMAAVLLAGAAPTVVGELRLARARVSTTLSITPLERREMFYTHLLSDVRAAKEVRLFGIGDHLRARMRACRVAINGLSRRLDLRTAFTQGGLAWLSAAVAAAGLLWALRSAAAGQMTIGDVSLFIAAVAAVQSSVDSLAFGVAACHQHLLLLGEYAAITRLGPDLPPADEPRQLPELRQGIELRDVWFRYSPHHPWVLKGVTLTIPCGQSVALVGTNGAGKSTLVKLLCRFYDPTRGSILWDGVDISGVPAAALRERTSAIFQDFMYYDMTASENIALGDLTAAADPDAITAAAARAGLHDKLASLPRGYETMLSRSFAVGSGDVDDGVMLSGGQWQRLALARAFLRDRRDLMILDEPSAGLDPEAEHEIHVRLREHRADQTSLLISHRLGAVRSADTIVVLDGGKIVELGGHDELVASGGRYARAFRLQAQGYLPTEERCHT